MRAADAWRSSRRTSGSAWTAVVTIGRRPFSGNFLLYQGLAVDPDVTAERAEAQHPVAAAAQIRGQRLAAAAVDHEGHLGVQAAAERLEAHAAPGVLGQVQLDAAAESVELYRLVRFPRFLVDHDRAAEGVRFHRAGHAVQS